MDTKDVKVTTIIGLPLVSDEDLETLGELASEHDDENPAIVSPTSDGAIDA